MEPLSPNDPLLKLLGQAKPVEPRANFVRDVVRAARQTPQERGWLAGVKAWWAEQEMRTVPLAFAAAAVAVAATLGMLWLDNPDSGSIQRIAQNAPPAAVIDPPLTEVFASPLPEVETQWTAMDQVDALLAVQDTSELTDREIAFLLY